MLAGLTVNAQFGHLHALRHVPGTYPTIQAAINAAYPGDTVLVADGTYCGQVNFMGKAITVASYFIMDGDPGHISRTILDGKLMTHSNGSIVLFTSGEDTTSILQGFTIQHGKGRLLDGFFRGGAIYIDGSGAKILNNHITKNILDAMVFPGNFDCGGAAVSTNYRYSSKWVVIENNTIDSNQCISRNAYAGGAAVFSCQNTRLVNNTITGNSVISVGMGKSYGIIMVQSINTPVFYAKLIALNNIIRNNTCESEEAAFGGAMWCSKLDATIVGNDISDNEITSMGSNSGGAGILVSGHYSSLIKGNIFSNNHLANLGGALYLDFSDPGTQLSVIEDNFFTGNEAMAGGAILSFLHLSLKNNTFVENTSTAGGGALYLRNLVAQTASDVENNIFKLNRAHKGGAVYTMNAQLNMVNNVFDSNQAETDKGGALYLTKTGVPSTNTRLINNAFSGNKAATRGGAIYSYGCNPSIINTIFYNDTAVSGQEISTDYGNVSVAFSNLSPQGVEGQVKLMEGMMFSNPSFCDSMCLMPMCTSECLNAGTGEYVFRGAQGEKDTLTAPSYDILNQPRPLENKYDMGAYELLYAVGVKNAGPATAFTTYPNPFTTNLECSYKLQRESQVKITLYNLTGVVIQSWQLTQPAGDHTKTLDLKNQSKGVYLLELKVDGTAASRKIIKI